MGGFFFPHFHDITRQLESTRSSFSWFKKSTSLIRHVRSGVNAGPARTKERGRGSEKIPTVNSHIQARSGQVLPTRFFFLWKLFFM